ncbi:MAG: hypothetical protein FE78DRAFT_88422 [Acidomyces sp. 'richmondensis']|nr:MAG: hypothetical protein FE78DRAFT_88422 [Acidomyces sp. 'richmondensis']
MHLALQDLRSSESPNISAIARKYGVKHKQYENARLLNKQQESIVIEYIRRQKQPSKN